MPKLYFLILLTLTSLVSHSQTIYEVQPQDEQDVCFLYAEFGVHGKSDVKIVVFSSYIYRYKYSTGYSHPVLHDEDVRNRLKLAFYKKIDAIVNNERSANISYLPHQKVEWAFKTSSHAAGTGPELYQTVTSATAFNRNVRSRILQDYRNKGYKIYQTTFDEFYDEGITILKLENIEKLSSLDYETYSPGCMKGIGSGSRGNSGTTTSNQQTNSSRSQGSQNSGNSGRAYIVENTISFKAGKGNTATESYYYNNEGVHHAFIFAINDKARSFYKWSDITSIKAFEDHVKIYGDCLINGKMYYNQHAKIYIEDEFIGPSVVADFKRLKAFYTGEPTEEEIEAAKRMKINKRLALVDKSKEGKLPTSSTKVTTSTVYYSIYAFDPKEIDGEQPTLYVSNVFPISKYSDGSWPLPVVIEKETASLTAYKEVFSGFYTDSKEAEAKLREMKTGFAEYGGKIKEVTYKGKGTATSTDSDFWGNGTKKVETKDKKDAKRDTFWDN